MTTEFAPNEQLIEFFQSRSEQVIDLDQYELAVVAGGSGDVVVC